MAVSYLSTPYESNPYVVPLDLGLLQKVNQYKQSQFYQNTDRLNTQFSQLNNLDIINPDQKAHATDVVNNLSTQIQQMGGLDYSDPNVSNTISGYAGDVYNDKTILNGIVSTKGIRAYQKNADTIKNDPKLNKYYDPAREWYDTQYDQNPNSVINYIKGGVNATYSGPTAPTPSLGSDWDILTKEIQRINPNIDERFDPSGNRFFIDKTTNKEVDESRIRQMVDGKIDGRVADQLNVHAAYNYYGLTQGKYSKEMGIQEYTNNAKNNYDRISNTINGLQQQITLEPDNDKRLDLEDKLKDAVNELPGAQQQLQKSTKDFSDLWDKSPQAAFYNLYTNKLKDDIGSVYSYRQTSRQLIVNQEALANARMDVEAAKEGYKLIRNADGSISRTKLSKNAGQTEPPLLGQLTRDFSSSEDLAKKQVNQQTVQSDIDKSQNDLNSGLRNVIYETSKIANVPGLFDDDNQTINNDPNANPISHSDLLKKVAQLTGSDTQLEKSDIDRVLQNTDKAGTFDNSGNFSFNATRYKYKPGFRKGLQADYTREGIGNAMTDAEFNENIKNGNLIPTNEGSQEYYNPKTGKSIVSLTAQQITFFKNVQGIMDDAANGKDITGRISNAGAWRQYMNKYTIEQNSIIANKKLLQTARDQVYGAELDKYNLTPQEHQEAVKYFNNPEAFHKKADPSYAFNPFSSSLVDVSSVQPDRLNVNPIMGNALSKIFGANGAGSAASVTNRLTGKVNELLNNTANRNNYYSILLPDESKDLEEQYPQIKNYLLQSDAFTADNSIVKKKEDIDPISVVTDGNKYFIKYGSRSDVNGKKGYAEITEDNLKSFGVPTVPYPSLEKTVSENGHLPMPIYIDPTATGNVFNKTNKFTGPVKIDLVNMNASGNRNDDNFTPAVIYNNKKYFYRPGNSKSANASLELLTNALQNNQTFKNIDDFINAIDNNNQQ